MNALDKNRQKHFRNLKVDVLMAQMDKARSDFDNSNKGIILNTLEGIPRVARGIIKSIKGAL